MTPEEKKELFVKLDQLKKSISQLRSSLNEIDGQKEDCFNKKEKYSQEIRDLIRKVKENKNKRDGFTKQVRVDKEARHKLNEDVKTKISKIKELKKVKEDLSKKHHIREDPFRIKQEAERLEFKIETEIMSFDKERKIMKMIKELKKKMVSSKEIGKVVDQMHNLSETIDHGRADAKEVHKKVQSRAQESQHAHEEILKISHDIDELKEKEKGAYEKFSEYKKKFTEVNNQLKDKLKEMSQIIGQVDKYKLDNKKRKEEAEAQILKSKEEIVEEKIKKRQKLTTEDILLFQGLNKE